MTVSRLFGWIAAIVLGGISAFFIFYTCRLLYVTRFMTGVRAGGQGAYIGLIAFPVIAIVAGWAAARIVRRLRVSGR
jgi:hypothetical protein